MEVNGFLRVFFSYLGGVVVFTGVCVSARFILLRLRFLYSRARCIMAISLDFGTELDWIMDKGPGSPSPRLDQYP